MDFIVAGASLQQCGVPQVHVQASQQRVHFNVDESAITLGVSLV